MVNGLEFSFNAALLWCTGDGLPEEGGAEDVPEHAVQPLHPRHSAVLGRALLQGDVWPLSTRLLRCSPGTHLSTDSGKHLSNLSTPVIQQFLDELSFMEMFAHYPLACFDALLAQISAQTQVNTCPTSPPPSFSSSWTSSPSGRCLATIHSPVLML